MQFSWRDPKLCSATPDESRSEDWLQGGGTEVSGPPGGICRVGRRDPPEAPIGRIGFRLAFARGSRRPGGEPRFSADCSRQTRRPGARPNGRPLSGRGREDCEERTPLWARELVAPFPRERSAVRKSTSWPAPGVRAQRRHLPQGRLSLGEREETSTRFRSTKEFNCQTLRPRSDLRSDGAHGPGP